MLRTMACFFIILIGDLFASPLSNHLKKISDKSGSNTIKNIDFIYMINLDERPEKYAHSMQELAPYGIIPYRFSAVNGWKLSVENLNDIGIKYKPWMPQNLMATCYLPEDQGQPRHEIMQIPDRNYFFHCLSPGGVGIVLSHLSILQDAYDSGYHTIWVMEDDIEVIENPHQLSDLIDQLDLFVGEDGWDILFTDPDTKNQQGEYVPCYTAALRPDFIPADPLKFQVRTSISLDLRKVGARYGAYSMIIRRSGMKKILDLCQGGIFLPYDMEYTLPDGIRIFTVLRDIVSTQPKAASDNGFQNYLPSITLHSLIEDFSIN